MSTSRSFVRSIRGFFYLRINVTYCCLPLSTTDVFATYTRHVQAIAYRADTNNLSAAEFFLSYRKAPKTRPRDRIVQSNHVVCASRYVLILAYFRANGE